MVFKAIFLQWYSVYKDTQLSSIASTLPFYIHFDRTAGDTDMVEGVVKGEKERESNFSNSIVSLLDSTSKYKRVRILNKPSCLICASESSSST